MSEQFVLDLDLCRHCKIWKKSRKFSAGDDGYGEKVKWRFCKQVVAFTRGNNVACENFKT